MSITQVAERAGVSPATVSLVINNKTSISPATARAVRQAMLDVGYVPAPEGQRRGRPQKREVLPQETFTRLALVSAQPSPWLRSPTYMDVLHGVEAAARESNATVLFHSAPGTGEKEFAGLEGNVDGLILLGKYPSERSLGSLSDLPRVKVMGVPQMSSWCDHITYKSEAIGYLAGTHLLEKGHQHVGCISLMRGQIWKTRQQAFEATVAEGGGSVKTVVAETALQAANSTQPINHEILRGILDELLESSPRPTGLFLSSDVLASPVYWLLLQRGLTPMKDIEIISCNNDRAFLGGLHPQPAIIDIHASRVAHRAVEQLLWRIQNPTAPIMDILIEPSLLLSTEGE